MKHFPNQENCAGKLLYIPNDFITNIENNFPFVKENGKL